MDSKALERMKRRADTAKHLRKSIAKCLNSDTAPGMQIEPKFNTREEYPLSILTPEYKFHKLKAALAIQAAALKSKLEKRRKQ